MAPRVKQAFEIASRHAERRAQPRIDPISLLFGIVDLDALANRLLRENGVDPENLRTVLSNGRP
jgi:hypothetical protein